MPASGFLLTRPYFRSGDRALSAAAVALNFPSQPAVLGKLGTRGGIFRGDHRI